MHPEEEWTARRRRSMPTTPHRGWYGKFAGILQELVASFRQHRSPSCLGIGKRTQINRWNSGAESCTGVGVIVGFSGPVGMLNSPHVQMAEIVLEKGYLHIL